MSALIALEAENEILCALAWHGREALATARDFLAGADDFSPENRAGYRVVEALAEQGAPFTAAAVTATAYTLGEDRLAERALEWTEELVMGGLGALENLAWHAQQVAEMAQRRALLAAAQQLATAAADRTIPIETSLAEMVTKATPRVAARRAEDATKDYLFETLQLLEDRASHDGIQTPGVPAKLFSLDRLTDGWMPSRLIVVAARPKCGKTALGMFCANAAVEEDIPVMFFSAEQPTRQLQFRRLALKGAIDLREATASKSAWASHASHVAVLANRMRQEPLVFDQAARTTREIRTSLQRQITKGFMPRLVIVDYLTKLKPEGRHERRDLAVGAMTGELSEIAKEFDLPVLLLAQLNRESVKDGKMRRPTMADLRDSGQIEQDADQILMLWPGAIEEGERLRDRAPGMEGLEIIVEANRHGPTGTVRVEWHKPTGAFTDDGPRWARSGAA